MGDPGVVWIGGKASGTTFTINWKCDNPHTPGPPSQVGLSHHPIKQEVSMRRRRFTATLNINGEPSRTVILAYTAEQVERHFTMKGYLVLNVTAGDYRKPEPQRQVAQGWRVSQTAIREACEFLGITRPVSIKVTNHRGGRYGAHQLRGVVGTRFLRGYLSDFDRADGVGHHITVKGWLTPEQASRTLWHELCHAMQAEGVIAQAAPDASPRVKYNTWTTAEARGKGVAYRNKPIEVEAREYESFATEMPLVRA